MNDNDDEGYIIDEVATFDSINCNTCWKYIACAFKIITQLSCHYGIYNNLNQGFKYIMLLSSTQVTCERLFSKFKVIKKKIKTITRSATFRTTDAYGYRKRYYFKYR
jgi:hypothetical protein